jgi:hypothetical protein
MLKREPRLEPTTLYEYLINQYPGQYEQTLRTLQRRVETWKTLYGDPKAVMFQLRHDPGEMGLSDFTKLKGVEITVNGKPFEHILYHYRLAYSGWQYVQIIQGGESFIGLSEGLQNALNACGGAPKLHRTDSLSAAYRNMAGKRYKPLTRFYDELCEHYRMRPTRNNTGLAHENGSIVRFVLVEIAKKLIRQGFQKVTQAGLSSHLKSLLDDNLMFFAKSHEVRHPILN